MDDLLAMLDSARTAEAGALEAAAQAVENCPDREGFDGHIFPPNRRDIAEAIRALAKRSGREVLEIHGLRERIEEAEFWDTHPCTGSHCGCNLRVANYKHKLAALQADAKKGGATAATKENSDGRAATERGEGETRP